MLTQIADAPDEELGGTSCVPRPVDARADGAGDLGPSADGAAPGDSDDMPADGGAPAADQGDGLGDWCQKHGDCQGKADFCIVMPGATDGYCTLQNCTAQPDDCPAGYTCLDLSQYVPNLPTACLKD